MDLTIAEIRAQKIVEQLRPFCSRIEIAGSIRRRRPHVNDIDLVVEPLPGKRGYIRDRCLSWRPQLLQDGQINLVFSLKETQVDIFFADEPGADLFAEPTNYGSLLVCRTGSKEFNVALCDRAKGRGLHWNPYRGVIEHGRVIASDTEVAVFQAVGLAWIKPEDREITSVRAGAV